jgi:hypothetical protein
MNKIYEQVKVLNKYKTNAFDEILMKKTKRIYGSKFLTMNFMHFWPIRLTEDCIEHFWQGLKNGRKKSNWFPMIKKCEEIICIC